MKPYGSLSEEAVREEYQPESGQRFAPVVVFMIGAMISIPTFIVGLDQEGSWLISQIGAILFCLTAIVAFMLVIMSTSKKANWDAAQGNSPGRAKISIAIYSGYVLTFSLAMGAVILTMIIH